MKQSGLATPHDLLGGALPGRIHVLTGPPGSGKSSACLYFLREGMRARERAALLTLDRPGDLRSHALHLGIDLRSAVRDGRLTILQYRALFAQRLAESATPERMIADLRHMIRVADLQQMFAPDVATRIAVDSVSPFLGAEPLGQGLTSLVDWLDHSGTSAMLTWNGDVTAAGDRRLEPLLERAAVILRFRHVGGVRFEATVVRARHAIATTAPVEFEIRPSRGIVTPAPDVRREPKPRAAEPILESLAPIVLDSFRAQSEAKAKQ